MGESFKKKKKVNDQHGCYGGGIRKDTYREKSKNGDCLKTEKWDKKARASGDRKVSV